MSLFRKLVLGVFAVSFSLSLSACASKLPQMEAFAEEADFGLLANENELDQFHGKHGGPFMGLFMKDLDLTEAQKTQLKSLFEEAHKNFPNKERMKQGKEIIKQAFLSEQFDTVALQAQLKKNLPDPASHSQTMASNLIKAWQILTPEQQAKLTEKMDKLEQKMQGWQKQGSKFGKGPHADHLQTLMQSLQISEEQKVKLQAIWDSNQSDRQERFTHMKELKTSVIAELRSTAPSTERLAALIAPIASKAHTKMGDHLEKFAAVHKILNSNQRQQLVSLMEQKMQSHHKRFGKGFGHHH